MATHIYFAAIIERQYYSRYFRQVKKTATAKEKLTRLQKARKCYDQGIRAVEIGPKSWQVQGQPEHTTCATNTIFGPVNVPTFIIGVATFYAGTSN